LKDFYIDRIQYGAIFNGYSNDRINITLIEGYSELLDYINKSSDLKKLMIEEDKLDSLEYRVKYIISGIVERYLYSINAHKIFQMI